MTLSRERDMFLKKVRSITASKSMQKGLWLI